MQVYKRQYSDDGKLKPKERKMTEDIKPDMKPQLEDPMPKVPMAVPTFREEEFNSTDIQSVVLMLNQVLTELAEINKKLNIQTTRTDASISSPISEGVKRKIILNRDETGKIIGADVIDSPQGTN